MKQINERIIFKTLNQLIIEQEDTATTDDTQENNDDSVFSDAEKKFLGKFDTFQSKHLGIIYSLTDIGIREFITRSSKQLECTPSLIYQLLRDKIIKIVPAGGYSSDTDYTIELQLSLDTVKGMGQPAADPGAAAGADAGATPPADTPVPPADAPAPPDLEGPPMESVVNFKDIISESVKVAKQLVAENKKKRPKDIDFHLTKSRILQRVPREFLYQLKRVISQMISRSKSRLDSERLIADILDVLQLNFDLTDHQIRRSYEFHKNQKRLQKYLDK